MPSIVMHFESDTVAEAFFGWMSDGGGEQTFMDVVEMQGLVVGHNDQPGGVSFDYQRETVSGDRQIFCSEWTNEDAEEDEDEEEPEEEYPGQRDDEHFDDIFYGG